MVDEAGLPEKTLEALKTSSAGSLPAAHDIIRLLFDMLVGSKCLAQKRYQTWLRSDLKERQLKGELDDLTARMNAMTRAHDMELTRGKYHIFPSYNVLSTQIINAFYQRPVITQSIDTSYQHTL